MSTIQNTQLMEQLREEYEELGGNLKDLDLYLVLHKNPTDAFIINLLKEKIDNLKKYEI
jgi:hypothetical protein